MEQVKKKRGRPRKDAAHSPLVSTTDGLGAKAPDGTGSGSVAAQIPVDPLAPQTAAIVIPPEALQSIACLPFEIASKSTGFEGFRLDETEAKMCGEQIDLVLKHYAPQLGGAHAVAVSALLTFGTVAYMKWSVYMEWKRKEEKIYTRGDSRVPHPAAEATA